MVENAPKDDVRCQVRKGVFKDPSAIEKSPLDNQIGTIGGDGDILHSMVLSSVVLDRYRPTAGGQTRLSFCNVAKPERLFLAVASMSRTRLR